MTTDMDDSNPPVEKPLRQWARALREFTETMRLNQEAESKHRRFQTVLLAVIGLLGGIVIVFVTINTAWRLSADISRTKPTAQERENAANEMRDSIRAGVTDGVRQAMIINQSVRIQQSKTIDEMVAEEIARRRVEKEAAAAEHNAEQKGKDP